MKFSIILNEDYWEGATGSRTLPLQGPVPGLARDEDSDTSRASKLRGGCRPWRVAEGPGGLKDCRWHPHGGR